MSVSRNLIKFCPSVKVGRDAHATPMRNPTVSRTKTLNSRRARSSDFLIRQFNSTFRIDRYTRQLWPERRFSILYRFRMLGAPSSHTFVGKINSSTFGNWKLRWCTTHVHYGATFEIGLPISAPTHTHLMHRQSRSPIMRLNTRASPLRNETVRMPMQYALSMSAIICRRISILRNESNLLAPNFTLQIKNTREFSPLACAIWNWEGKKQPNTKLWQHFKNFSQCRTFEVATRKLVGNNLILREYCAFNGNANDTSTTTCRPTHNTSLQSSIYFQLLCSQRISRTWCNVELPHERHKHTSHTNLTMQKNERKRTKNALLLCAQPSDCLRRDMINNWWWTCELQNCK